MIRITRLMFLLLLVLNFSCKKEKQTTANQLVDSKVKFTSDTFNDLYLWYNTMPSVDLTTFKTPEEYISTVKNSKDRWSFTMTYTDMLNLLQNGVTTGWGAGIKYDAQNLLRIIYVYDNSAMGKAGIKRGWQIKALNGKLVSTMSVSEINTALSNSSNVFNLIANDGTESTLNLTKGAIVINSVQYSNIYPISGRKIGYLVFNEFLGSSVKELNTVFDNFSSAGISDLILDLRYNGGGTLDCADSLVAILAGKLHKDKIYNTLKYNDKHTNLNFTESIKLKNNSVQLDKLVVIANSSTASASELVISGLMPYMNLKLIGSATQGKPVGMNITGDIKLNIAVAPISFQNVNSQGYTDYFNGIPPDFPVNDTPSQDWGALTDGCLTAALNYISTGTIGFVPGTKSSITPEKIVYKGSDTPVENLFQFVK
ncbi:MAG: S41 family peptidase [Mariniphaga sp.]